MQDIMSGDVVKTTAETPVAEVAREMVKARVGSAIVMQGSWLIGILSERDVLRAAASGKDLTTSPASEWMTKDPTTATPDTTSDEAAQLMLQGGFRHLPVVEGREVKGVVSIRDLLAARIRRP
ncbi:MAG: CBS domain-containing protein [Actinomycetota bacterium]